MAFAKSEHKVFAVTYDEHGNLEYIKTDGDDVLLELGERVTTRASHVEPVAFWLRLVFHILRSVVSDKSVAAAWTRVWPCDWRVNTAPVGGPILTWGDVYSAEQKQQMTRIYTTRPEYIEFAQRMRQTATWRNRQDAIDAEIKFLNEWFLSR
jgi:hypothetical protein